ncbi:MAG TPA: TetR/AcrR family transcriptional regulator [Candidatus Binatia bacterium]|nr:TetR/AcrR family transcriptional regulator [Candidatus Binatia bacterium]
MGAAAKHKESLVRSAMRLFRRQGYASTGLQQILAESGAPRGSLYHYFPSGKESLGEAAVGMAGDLIREMLESHAARHPDPKAFVQAWSRTMAGWMEESGFQSGCPIATTVLETAPRSPAITLAGRNAVDGWIDVVADVLARDGMPAREARSRAQLLIAAMEGALILARVRQSKQPILDVAKLVRGPARGRPAAPRSG